MGATTDRAIRRRIRFYLVDHSTPTGKAIDISLLTLNLAFVAVFVAETYPLPDTVRSALWPAELIIAAVFLVEYILRIYGAQSRSREFFNVYTMVDLAAILPTILVAAFPAGPAFWGIGFLRVIRVVRVLRFYRFTQDAEFFFGTVSDNALRSFKLLLTVVVLFFVSAGMFYSAESAVNPEVSNFGDAFYYVVVTLTTVGFGDITPLTSAGRWITVGSILGGIILIPWQAGKIVREWTARDTVEVTCPDCGLSSHDADASHCKACGHVIYQEYDGHKG